MHERALAEHLIELVETHARRAGAERVVAVDLTVGEHSHVVEASLQMHFDALATARGSLAAGATLRVRRVPLRLRCNRCGRDYTPTGKRWRCPACDGAGRLREAGDVLRVESLEVER